MILGLISIGLSSKHVLTVKNKEGVASDSHRDGSLLHIDVDTPFDITIVLHDNQKDVGVFGRVLLVGLVIRSELWGHNLQSHNDSVVIFIIRDGSANVLHFAHVSIGL